LKDDFDDPLDGVEEVGEISEDDLRRLPGPAEEEPTLCRPGHKHKPRENVFFDDGRKAEAGHAAWLDRVAREFGALDARPGGLAAQARPD
jgi:hypothetical protein